MKFAGTASQVNGVSVTGKGRLAGRLSLLSWMILNDPPAAQAMQQDLLDWLPAFNERCQSISDRFGFYPAITALLLQVVLNDHDE